MRMQETAEKTSQLLPHFMCSENQDRFEALHQANERRAQ
jgi:hypothetical protein